MSSTYRASYKQQGRLPLSLAPPGVSRHALRRSDALVASTVSAIPGAETHRNPRGKGGTPAASAVHHFHVMRSSPQFDPAAVSQNYSRARSAGDRTAGAQRSAHGTPNVSSVNLTSEAQVAYVPDRRHGGTVPLVSPLAPPQPSTDRMSAACALPLHLRSFEQQLRGGGGGNDQPFPSPPAPSHPGMDPSHLAAGPAPTAAQAATRHVDPSAMHGADSQFIAPSLIAQSYKQHVRDLQAEQRRLRFLIARRGAAEQRAAQRTLQTARRGTEEELRSRREVERWEARARVEEERLRALQTTLHSDRGRRWVQSEARTNAVAVVRSQSASQHLRRPHAEAVSAMRSGGTYGGYNDTTDYGRGYGGHPGDSHAANAAAAAAYFAARDAHHGHPHPQPLAPAPSAARATDRSVVTALALVERLRQSLQQSTELQSLQQPQQHYERHVNGSSEAVGYNAEDYAPPLTVAGPAGTAADASVAAEQLLDSIAQHRRSAPAPQHRPEHFSSVAASVLRGNGQRSSELPQPAPRPVPRAAVANGVPPALSLDELQQNYWRVSREIVNQMSKLVPMT